ncbi:hypothetical protein [Streptomyces sp. Ncost-T10-10d]|uniref:hypothetical protein n=1 Tax=Streptomyces sp. Ncost-T10-10d TaxID=1839774 RepID=UPI00081D3907|nr:hypothetical protein [Streptomyces sp. Ncost-T10-10d]SCF69608.1 hypothetical protein GA0115254_1117100 [Streptomyces sp. Ncost-T10-10d]
MDQYDSQRSSGRQRHAQDVTPIYDRLLAEWQAARGGPEPAPSAQPHRPCAGSRVPGARISEEDVDG